MFVKIKNIKTNEIEQVKVGFSWTVFFFGCFVPLIRGDWKWLLIFLIANPCTFGIFGLILAFTYNKIYLKEKLNSNWIPNSDQDESILKSANIIF